MSQKNGHALESVTLTAMLRRWTSSLLLIAVAAAGALSAMILQNLTIRQENALSSTIENTTISCTVTNAKGTDSGNLQMLSAFVEMLEGKRRLRECYLDDYVKNVRAKAKMSLEKPEGATLSRILSIDSDPALSQAEGVYVRFFEGWEEEDLRGQEQVCLISSDMFTDGEYITVAADMGESARLRIIGTVANGPSNEIYCPYFMSWSEGVSVAFLTDSCSFDIRNNQKLEESKSYIYEWFVRPDLSNQMDGLTFGVLVHDETYQKNIEEIQANLSMLRLLLPVLIIVCGGIGFFASFLATRGRTKEFAVMRCLGMKQCKIFGLVMGELSILAFTGALFGIAGGILLEGEIQTSALLHAALMTGIFFTRFRGCSTSDHKHKCYESHEGGGLNMNILTSKQVTYEYRNAVQTVRAVNGVSCTFQQGHVYAIVGPSGSGKTTFLSLLAGLDVPTSGTIELDGESTAKMNRDSYRLNHVSVIYQNFNLFQHLTVLENAAYPLYVRKMPKKKADELAAEKLLQVGLKEDQFKRFPNMLSGGEQQRVAIARALTSGSELILADEPTGNLDSENSRNIVGILQGLAHEGNRCVIIVTHDPAVAEVADVLLKMKDGKLIH